VSETIKITRALVALKQRSVGLSGVDLAIRLRVNQPFMSRVLAGKRLPGRGLAGQAQRAYGIPIAWWDEEVSSKPADLEKTEAEIAAWFEKNPPPEPSEVGSVPGAFPAASGDR
jgi:hypothetical protein